MKRKLFEGIEFEPEIDEGDSLFEGPRDRKAEMVRLRELVRMFIMDKTRRLPPVHSPH